MFNELLTRACDIIIIEAPGNNSIDYLELIEKILGILSTFVVLVGGILGISYIHKLKENNLNATFGYCSRLKVYIRQIQEYFNLLEDDFHERMLPQEQRKLVEATHNDSTTALMTVLVHTSRATLEFLKNDDCQFPGSLDWNKKINTLLEFLIDCDKIDNQESYVWYERDAEQYAKYRKTHTENFNSLIDSIDTKIEEVEKKLYGKKWWQIWKKSRNRNKKKQHSKNTKTK